MKNIIIKLLPFLFTLYPILNIYSFPIGPLMPIGDVVFILFGIILISQDGLKYLIFPPGFIKFWVYIGIVYFILNIPYFKITNFFPGGISFCSMTVTMLVCIRYLDFGKLKKYYKIIAFVVSCFFLFQELSYASIGIRPPLLFIGLPLANGQDVSDLAYSQTLLDRSSSFFREPAHMACFLLPILYFELFDVPNSNTVNKKLFTPLSLFIIFILVLLQSGNGFLGLTLLLVGKCFTYLRENNGRVKLVFLLLFLPIFLYGVIIYANSEKGYAIMERASGVGLDKDSESFDRTFRAYYLYAEMPYVNKIFGMSQNELSYFINHSSIKNLFGNNGYKDTYMNGIQNVLCHYGIIGLFLYICIFVKLYKNKNRNKRIFILLFLILMMVSDLFISSLYILTILIVFQRSQKRKVSSVKSHN